MTLDLQIQTYTDNLEKKTQTLSGLLGLAIGGSRVVDIASRPGFVYVRLRDNLSEVIQATNDKVSPVYDFPVLVERRGTRWVVTGKDDLRYSNWGTPAPFLPAHGDQHSFNRDTNSGGDAVFVYPDQFMPLLVYPSGSAGAGNLMIAPYMLQRDTDFIYVGNTGTGNLLVYKPTNNQAIMGLVYLDTTTGNPGVLIASGSSFSATITGSAGISSYIPYPASSDHEPLYAFRLTSGTTSLNWSSLYNARQFIGGQGGGSSVVTGSTVQAFITGSIPFAGTNGNLKEDNTRFRWHEDFRGLRIGTDSPPFNTADLFPLGIIGYNQNESEGMGILVYGTGTSGSPSPVYNGYRARGNVGAFTPVKSGDALVSYVGAGYDGANWQNASRVRFYADGDWITGTYLPTRYEVDITPSGSATRRTQFTVYGDSTNQPTGSTYNIGGVPHTHAYVATDGWISTPETWTARTQAFTNDPAAGSNIVLNMADTSGAYLGQPIRVSSGAGTDDTIITAIVANTSITAQTLAVNHNTTSRLVTFLSCFTLDGDQSTNVLYQKYIKIKFTQTTVKYGVIAKNEYIGANSKTYINLFSTSNYGVENTTVATPYISKIENPDGFPGWFDWPPILSGFSILPTNQINRWHSSNNAVECAIRWATGGTSNATTLTWSLPFVSKTITNMYWISLMRAVDNGVLITGGAMGYISSASTVCECFTSFAGGVWTASGTKYITIGNITYEA